MGVDLAAYRSRIGTFGHSVGVDVLTVVCCVNFFGGLKTAGSVVFIGLLLLIAGIESNPGPSSKDKAKTKQVSIIPGNANGRKAVTAEQRKRTATIEIKDIQAHPAKRRFIFQTQTRDVKTHPAKRRLIFETQTRDVKKPPAKRRLIVVTRTREQNNWDVILASIMRTGMYPKEKLKEQVNLPDQQQLNKLLEIHFHKRSDTILDVLKQVEVIAQKKLRSKHRTVKNVWLAYRTEGKLKCGVIMVNANRKDINVHFLNLETCVYTPDDHSEEARKIKDYNEKNQLDHSVSFKKLVAAQKCISDIADELMNHHRFLFVIKLSPVRSKGFSSPNHTIKKETCIALYVQKKGYIPVSEKPFKYKYQGFNVDVREGAFYACKKTERKDMNEIKMGFKISRVQPNNAKSGSFGTLGGFLEHPEYGTCGITSAHVLLDESEMLQLQEKNVLTFLDFESDILVKVCKDDGLQIGRVVKAVYEKGDSSSSGFEVAIFQINDDLQTVGAFWNATVKGDDKKHRFDFGRVRSTTRLDTSSGIVKFGARTGKTEGKCTSVVSNVSIKFQSDRLPDPMILHNQIEIKGDHKLGFGNEGDSGSLLMVKGAKGETSCVGIFEGITDENTCIASPFGPILERMSVSSLKCFHQEKLSDAVETLQVDVKKILAILKKKYKK